jgi:uncharacterized protein with HEPN domain
VRDILSAITEIQGFVEGMSCDEFCADLKTLRAVTTGFIIIGEAAAQMPDDVVARHSSVPWSVMRGMRNTLVHAYFDIDPRIVWDTIQTDLPQLLDPLRTMLDSVQKDQD